MMHCEWVGPDRVVPLLGGSFSKGDKFEALIAVGESLIKQGLAKKVKQSKEESK